MTETEMRLTERRRNAIVRANDTERALSHWTHQATREPIRDRIFALIDHDAGQPLPEWTWAR